MRPTAISRPPPTCTRRRWNSRPALPRPGSRSARRARRSATATARARRSSARAAADRDDRHGAALHLARLGGADPATQALHGYVRTLFDQYAPRFDRALADLSYSAPEMLRDAVTKHGHALRHHARSRLRHRARGRGVPPACRLAGRGRSLAEDDRGGARGRASTTGSRSATSRRFSPSSTAQARIWSSRRMCSPISRDLRRRSAPRWRACWRPAGCSASRSRRMTARARSSGRRCAMRTARILCAVRSREAGLTLVELTRASSRTENRVPVPGLLVLARR